MIWFTLLEIPELLDFNGDWDQENHLMWIFVADSGEGLEWFERRDDTGRI